MTPTPLPVPTMTLTPSPAFTPTPKLSPAPKKKPKKTNPKKSTKDKKTKKTNKVNPQEVKFIHQETVEDGCFPRIALPAEKIWILSVRFNGRECPRHREDGFLVVDREAVSGQGTVEALAVTEDGTVLEMEPWSW